MKTCAIALTHLIVKMGNLWLTSCAFRSHFIGSWKWGSQLSKQTMSKPQSICQHHIFRDALVHTPSVPK
jgi:hypothetical protein